MRIVRSLPDVQLALNDLYKLHDDLRSKNLNLSGRKVQNASPAKANGEYVTFEQLPIIPNIVTKHNDQHFGIVITKDGTVNDGDISPAYAVARQRVGTPYEVMLTAEGAPVATDLIVNILYTTYEVMSGSFNPTTVSLLKNDLHLPKGQTRPVTASVFIDPTPTLAYGSKLNLTIIKGSSASQVSITLLVRRLMANPQLGG